MRRVGPAGKDTPARGAGEPQRVGAKYGPLGLWIASVALYAQACRASAGTRQRPAYPSCVANRGEVHPGRRRARRFGSALVRVVAERGEPDKQVRARRAADAAKCVALQILALQTELHIAELALV